MDTTTTDDGEEPAEIVCTGGIRLALFGPKDALNDDGE